MAERRQPEETAGPAEALALGLARGVCRSLKERGAASLTEFTLRSGRRADVLAVAEDGRVTIVEIKTSVADYRSDGKWPDYLDFCDFFYFAVPEDFPRDLIPESCGLMIADAYEAVILRPSEARPMNGTRRRALILRFARLAALRLAALSDPGDGSRD